MAETAAQSGSEAPMGLSGADPSSHREAPPAAAVEAEALLSEEERYIQILDAFELAPPAPALQAGLTWRLATLPFYAIAGGMGVVLGALRLGAWAIRRAFSLVGLAHGGAHPLPLLESGAAGSDEVAARAALLPLDVVMEIACRLGASRRDAQAMRSTCPAWRRAIPNTNGPLLLMSRSPLNHQAEGTPKVSAFALHTTSGGDPYMDIVPYLCQPPANTLLWGAADGVLALQQEDLPEELFLFCLNCGGTIPIPQLPEQRTTGITWGSAGGIFFYDLPATPFAIFASEDIQGQAVYSEQTEGCPVPVGWRWEEYPGSEGIESLAFLEGVHFVGISDGMLVIAERGWPLEDHIVRLHIDYPVDGMLPWHHYGNHVFSCGKRIFVCIMLRSVSDEDAVTSVVFLLDRVAHAPGYAIARVYDIGSFSVYLGGNKTLVLPAIEGSVVQRANSLYVINDDGITRRSQVLAIDVSSGEVAATIPFPLDVTVDDFDRAFWVAPPPINASFWHCSTDLGH